MGEGRMRLSIEEKDRTQHIEIEMRDTSRAAMKEARKER